MVDSCSYVHAYIYTHGHTQREILMETCMLMSWVMVITGHAYDTMNIIDAWAKLLALYLWLTTTTYLLEFTPCPIYECKNGAAQLIQQPADLRQLPGNLASAATSFIQSKAGKRHYTLAG